MAIDLITRKEWGARAPKGSYDSLASTRGVKIHYTGGRVDPATVDDHDLCAAAVRGIQRGHMDSNGWLDIGYSFIACPHRKVFEGRGLHRLPAANGAGLNSGHYAVLGLVGNSGLVVPPDGMLHGIVDAIEYCRSHGAAGKEIKGHRDGYSTSCLPLDSTEVLTRRGWVPLGDVQADDDVASWSLDSGQLAFDRPAGIIEPYEATTMLINGFETTPDHNWITYGQKARAVGCSCGFDGSAASIRSHVREGRRRGEEHDSIREERWKLVRADEMGQDFAFPRAVPGSGPGLDLTDDQIRLIVWFQGDGHIMQETRGRSPAPYGVEWHLRKPRKIERLAGLLRSLGIEYRQGQKADGTVSIRVYGDLARDRIISLLPNKTFTWDLLDLSPAQAEVFLEELMHVDGCAAGSYYSSTVAVNLDVVQAVASINGRAAVGGDGVVRLRAGRKHSQWRGLASRFEDGRTTRVGCLTTVNGTLVVRQGRRVVVVGNCPGPKLYAWVREGAPRPDSGVLSPPPAKPVKPATAPAFPGRLLSYPPATTGADVYTWQARMRDRGWDLIPDADYGPRSKEVCRLFQLDSTAHGWPLDDDGTVGRETWKAAFGRPVTP